MAHVDLSEATSTQTLAIEDLWQSEKPIVYKDIYSVEDLRDMTDKAEKDLLEFSGVTTSVLRDYTLKSPFDAECKENARRLAFFLNCPLIGLAHNPDPITHPLRNGLMVAEARQYACVFLTGNLIHIDVTRASSMQGFRMFVSHTEETGKTFVTVEERIESIFKLLRKEFFTDYEAPCYNGPIYIVFGRSEDLLINYWVSQRVNEIVAEEKALMEASIREKTKKIKQYKKAFTSLLEIEDREGIEQVEAALEKEEDELVDLEVERSHMKATLVDPDLKKKLFLGFQKQLIELYEKNLPGVKVISTGNCVVRLWGRTILIKQNPRQSVADTYAGFVETETRSNLKSGGEVPNLIVLAGYNVTGLQSCINDPEAKDDPRKIINAELVQLPVCLNDVHLKQLADRAVTAGSFLTKLIDAQYFAAGALAMGWPENFFTVDYWYARDLAPQPPQNGESPSLAYEMFSNWHMLKEYCRRPFLIYIEAESDMQEGGKQQAYYELPDFPYRRSLYDFHHRFFLDHKLPISSNWNLGDICQGENHEEYHLEVRTGYLQPYDMSLRVQQILATSLSPEEKARELSRLTIKNTWDNGVQRVDDQLEQYIKRSYEDGSEYYRSVLENAARIKVEYIEQAAPITIIGGNHFGNTKKVGKHFNEAGICEYRLRDILHDKYGYSREKLQKLVLAPMGSAKTVSRALGAFGTNGVYPYCISIKHKPGAGAARGKVPVTILRASRVRIGVTEPVFKGRFVIEMAGHIDRKSACMMKNSFLSLSPGQEFQSAWAEEMDFALADCGTVVIGVPAPAHHIGSKEIFGPVVHISFAAEVFYDYIKHPWEIHPEVLLPNAL